MHLGNVHKWHLILVCTIIDFEEKFPHARLLVLVCMVLFWSARLLILRKKIPPAQSYFGLHDYWFWGKIPTCMFISSCTSIRYTRVSLLIICINLSIIGRFICFSFTVQRQKVESCRHQWAELETIVAEWKADGRPLHSSILCHFGPPSIKFRLKIIRDGF